MELHFMGTGAGMPSKERNVTSICLNMNEERGTMWMFDCGEGTQHQILRTSLKLGRLEKLFITHLHGDHLYGLPGVLTSRSNHGAETHLDLYGPAGLRAFVETALRVSEAFLGYTYTIHEVEEGVVFEDEQVRVLATKLEHRIESFGYRIEEKEKPGRLCHEKLKALGIPPGPQYAQIKRGEDITLTDGSRLKSADFLEAPIPGRQVVILGDTRVLNKTIAFSKNADVLVHEATFGQEREALARKYYHATAAQAAHIASEAKAATLILTHISSRYQHGEEQTLLKEAKEQFENTHLARDFWYFSIPRKTASHS
ncbi:ribonuclease Z [Marinicrinis sediminis]|uniref:Ribonuclease Z n=1 Tax=Marinicrinis sediminis TaxID=1652465 RepID=A0ABW5RF42_9BACL